MNEQISDMDDRLRGTGACFVFVFVLGGGGVVSIITKWREKNIKTVQSIFFYFLNSLKTQNIIYTIIFGAMHILYIVIISGVQYRLTSAKNIFIIISCHMWEIQ